MRRVLLRWFRWRLITAPLVVVGAAVLFSVASGQGDWGPVEVCKTLEDNGDAVDQGQGFQYTVNVGVGSDFTPIYGTSVTLPIVQ